MAGDPLRQGSDVPTAGANGGLGSVEIQPAESGGALTCRQLIGCILPIPLIPRAEPFDNPGWLFEFQYDGLRSLAFIDEGTTRLISRQGETYMSFQRLCAKLARDVKVHDAILDGEIVCFDEAGKPRFDRLLKGRYQPCYCAFDVVWWNGTDLRGQPLHYRKKVLRKIIANRSLSVLCIEYVIERGISLFHAACARRFPGVVAKEIDAPYGKRTPWLSINNPAYPQR